MPRLAATRQEKMMSAVKQATHAKVGPMLKTSPGAGEAPAVVPGDRTRRLLAGPVGDEGA